MTRLMSPPHPLTHTCAVTFTEREGDVGDTPIKHEWLTSYRRIGGGLLVYRMAQQDFTLLYILFDRCYSVLNPFTKSKLRENLPSYPPFQTIGLGEWDVRKIISLRVCHFGD